MGVMMYSLCVNNRNEKLHFHIIVDDSVTKQQKAELKTVISDDAEISFYLINIEDIRQYLIVKIENFPIPIYYRLLVAKILPADISKVLYLDADMIVRKDLSELWNTRLDNVAVAGVPNQSDCGQYWKRLEYPKEQGYFNSGVLLINLEYIRKHNLTEDFIDFIKNSPEKLLCPDQDVLNKILKDRKILLPVRFNAQDGFYRVSSESIYGNRKEFETDIEDPYIVHYTKDKPWSSICNHPLRNLYYIYKNETIWSKNNFMERFKYNKIERSLILRIKIYIASVVGSMINKQEEIAYKEIHLDR